MTIVYTGEPAPTLVVPALSGETFNLAERKPKIFTVVIFYRGSHCPICKSYLQEIQENYQKFLDAGFDVVAVSMDSKETAMRFSQDIAAQMEDLGSDALTFPIAYGLTEEQARSWGLYISCNREGTKEPAVFSEPGLFVMKPDTNVFLAIVQSAPFTRPNMNDLIGGLQYAHENDYPTRGSLTKQK